MDAADALNTLLDAEATALRRADAEQVLAFAGEKARLVEALRQSPPTAEVMASLIQKNRDNGLLARSGLSVLNQVLGSESRYGKGSAVDRTGQFLSKSA